MTVDSKESVLSRWSRRKLETRQQAPESGQAPPAEAPVEMPGQAAQETLAPVEQADQPVLTDADMPDIDSLDENSDFSVFMSSGVSDELRNLALRKLFGAPAFNIRDGLDEYDEDYTSFEKLGDIVTCDMKHQVEMEQQRLREALADEQRSAEGVETESGELEVVEKDKQEEPDEADVDELARLDGDLSEPVDPAEDEPQDEQ